MAPNSCPPVAVAGVVASLFVAASLSATLYATTTTSSTLPPNTTSTTISATSSSVTTTSSPNYDTPCGYCGPNISVTLRVENALVGNLFNHSLTMISHERELIHFLTEAADKKAEFKFSATYYANMGFFITTMNGLSSNGTAYWKLVDGNDVALSVGVSSYKPKDGETIVFSYTTGGH